MRRFTEEQLRQLYPHKEAILYNIETAFCLKIEREADRIEKLCKCKEALRLGNVDEAIKLSNEAHYFAMAEAIPLYFS